MLAIIPSIPAPHVTIVFSISSSLLHDRTTCLPGLVAFLLSRYFFLPPSCYFFRPPSLPPDYRCLPPSSHLQFDSGNASFTSFNHLLPTFVYFSSFLFFFKMGGFSFLLRHTRSVLAVQGDRAPPYPHPPVQASLLTLPCPSFGFHPLPFYPSLLTPTFLIHVFSFIVCCSLSVSIYTSPIQSPLFLLPLVCPLPSPVPCAPTVPRAVVL